MHAAVDVFEIDSSPGGKAIGLMDLFGQFSWPILGVGLNSDQKAAKAAEDSACPGGKFAMAVHGSSLATWLRRTRRQLVSGLKQDQPHADAHNHGLGASGRAKLIQDGTDMELDGVVGDTQTRSYFAFPKALGEHAQYLNLARC